MKVLQSKFRILQPVKDFRAERGAGYGKGNDAPTDRGGDRVTKAPAIEGATVHTGDLLIELEPFDLIARQGQANAQLEAATASEELAKLTFDQLVDRAKRRAENMYYI